MFADNSTVIFPINTQTDFINNHSNLNWILLKTPAMAWNYESKNQKQSTLVWSKTKEYTRAPPHGPLSNKVQTSICSGNKLDNLLNWLHKIEHLCHKLSSTLYAENEDNFLHHKQRNCTHSVPCALCLTSEIWNCCLVISKWPRYGQSHDSLEENHEMYKQAGLRRAL